MAGGGTHDGHRRVPAADRRAGARYRRRLTAAFGLIGAYFVVELVGGLLTNSLALLSDAGHMLTDVLGLGMALAAIHTAGAADGGRHRTFGLYRLEILAALANAVLLFGVAIYILVEAVRRLSQPPEVLGGPLLVVALVGLGVNLTAFLLLRGGAGESLNVEGAYLEVVADTLGSLGVIVAAVVLQTTGFRLIDPLFGVAIGLFVLPRTWRLGRRALRILVQAAPPDLDITAVTRHLQAIDGVAEAHDLHLWTLTSGMEVGSVHLRLTDSADSHAVLDQARNRLRTDFGVEHATIQVEPAEHEGCDDCRECRW